MGAFEKFPYTNFHDLNLDWIMRKIKSLEEKITTISPTDIHDLPAGGAKGQVLSKASGEDYDVAWDTIEIPETHDLPTGGTTGQVLTKSSNADYATEWKDPEKATEYTLPVATTTDLGGIKAAVDSVPDSNTRCGIEVESDGTAYASVPKAATDSYGLVKAGAATASDTVDVHIDSSGKLVVTPSNVPGNLILPSVVPRFVGLGKWFETNTTAKMRTENTVCDYLLDMVSGYNLTDSDIIEYQISMYVRRVITNTGGSTYGNFVQVYPRTMYAVYSDVVSGDYKLPDVPFYGVCCKFADSENQFWLKPYADDGFVQPFCTLTTATDYDNQLSVHMITKPSISNNPCVMVLTLRGINTADSSIATPQTTLYL